MFEDLGEGRYSVSGMFEDGGGYRADIAPQEFEFNGQDVPDNDLLQVFGSNDDEQFFVENPTDYMNRTGGAEEISDTAQAIISRGVGEGPDTIIIEQANLEEITIIGGGGEDSLVKSASFPGDLDPSRVTLETNN